LPDYHVGRFSVFTVDESENMVAKTIFYESEIFNETQEWQTKALVAVSNLNQDHNHGAHLKNFFYQNNYDTVFDYRARNQNLISNNVTKAVDEGASWIIYMGTGDAKSWHITGGYTNYQVENVINNFEKLPVIISVGCSNADIDFASDDCFGESWTKTRISKGAVAFISATETTPFFLSDTLGKHIVFSYFSDSSKTLGQAFSNAKIATYEAFKDTSTDEEIEEVLQEFMLLGDPTLRPWSKKATKPELDFSWTNDKGNIKLNVVVKDSGKPLKNVNVCISNNNLDLQIVKKTDNSGKADFDFNYTEKAYLNIAISGKNLVTTIDSFDANSDGTNTIERTPKVRIAYFNESIGIFSEKEISGVMIFNREGKLLSSQEVNSTQYYLSKKQYLFGIYFLKLLFENGQVVGKTIVVN
jgi:hypothetical protein